MLRAKILLATDYWQAAAAMAYFFFKVLGVKTIGLFGSLARGERANDVDLILFSNELMQRLPSHRRNGKYTIHLEKSIPFIRAGSCDYRILNILVKQFASLGITFDVQIFPERLDESFLELVRQVNPDPKFIWNVAKDILFWDKTINSFKKNDVLWRYIFGSVDLSSKTTVQIISGNFAGEGSALVVGENGGPKICLDCGADASNGFGKSEKTWRTVERLLNHRPDYVVLTHYHYDHFGALPHYLLRLKESSLPWPMIVASQQTFNLLCSYLEQIRRYGFPRLIGGGWLIAYGRTLYREEKTDRIELIPNQHSVPGSCSVLIKGKKSIFYTGDFSGIAFPTVPPVDLLIIDSTNGLKTMLRDPQAEENARNNVWTLVEETVGKNSQSKAYIALFSTQLDRAVWLYSQTLQKTGRHPNIDGASLFWNMKTYHPEFWSESNNYRIALMTGVWAQGEASLFAQSALVRLSCGTNNYRQIKKGDLVVLSASIPVWSQFLTSQIKEMCIRLNKLGARVVVDESAPEDWGSFAERRKVHEGGHGNFPEIANVIRKLNPKKVLPFHASLAARQKVADFCRQNGIEIIFPGSLITV